MHNPEQVTLLLIKGAISDLSQEDQDTVRACAHKFRTILESTGAQGMLAYALVGAEIAVKEI